MEIIGIIKKIYPIQEGVSKSTGNPWKSMEFLLETEDRYPQSACFQLMNDNCTRFDIKEGDKSVVGFIFPFSSFHVKLNLDFIAWKVDKI